MTVPTSPDIDRVVLITVDCLRWEFSAEYRDIYPDGIWYQASPQATYTPTSHASLFTSLNPPRHGLLSFKMDTDKETFLENTNSVSASGIETTIFDEPLNLADKHVDQVAFEHFIDKPDLHEFLDKYDGDVSDLVAEHDLTFLHDWLVHATGPGYEDEWSSSIAERDHHENWRAYQEMVDYSLRAHENMLDELKANGLYENTLFVVWGDHGQSMFEPAYGCTMHCHYPEDGVSRTPIGFLSPQFDGLEVDTDTNARSVDVVPTLYSLFETAQLPFSELSHEEEGVDLTEFEGALAAYALGESTINTGADDGIKGSEWTYLATATESMAKYTPDDDDDVQERHSIHDVPERYEEYRKLYKDVRRNSNKLIMEEH